ncbi:aldose reductase-related protein 2 [Labrus mixtus]|uniref:aldose reductase-related protein 2 n=1 Tax=Labrus mixtus TaxID=508554 RepID=UPI0029C0050F|nr:aldose reductase-related protein 2 [Labrus mixtus]
MYSTEDSQVARTIELNDGTRMPVLGLGTWKSYHLPRTSTQGAVEAAIAAGYRHIDTAYNYGNEVEIGKALRSKMQQGIINREDMYIVSKLWLTHYAQEDIPVCLNKSLNDLKLDYLDLYLVHFPVGFKKMGDELFPKKDGQMLTSDIDYVDVWRGMEALQASGKVKSIGVSNFNILQLERLLALCRVPPAVNQVELHPYLVQTELIEFCKSRNIALTAYSPFGSPARPPELFRGEADPQKLLDDPVIAEIAKKHRRSPAQVLLRYHVQQGISVIPKSDRPHHILENTKVFDFHLTEEDMRALRGLDRGWRAVTLPEVSSHPYYPFDEVSSSIKT